MPTTGTSGALMYDLVIILAFGVYWDRTQESAEMHRFASSFLGQVDDSEHPVIGRFFGRFFGR